MNDINHLGSIDGAQMALHATGSQQTILVQVGDTGQHLVHFLGLDSGTLEVSEVDGVRYWHVPHDGQLDRFLRNFIDILIAIRYLHPAFVQLQMNLL